MILAVAALLLHSAAVPQIVASRAGSSSDAVGPSSNASNRISTSPSAANMSPTLPEFDPAEPEFDAGATYMPGRSALEEVSPSFASPATPVTVIVVPVPALTETSGLEPAAERARAERRRNREWLALAIAQHSAATFDAWSTRRAVSSGGGVEANPLLRPFAGNGSLYAAIQVGPLVLDYVGRRMMHSAHPWMRHTWWAPEAAGTVLSFVSGVHNLSNVR